MDVEREDVAGDGGADGGGVSAEQTGQAAEQDSRAHRQPHPVRSRAQARVHLDAEVLEALDLG